MKTIKNLRSKASTILLSVIVAVLSPIYSYAQQVDLDDLSDGMDDIKDTALEIVEVVMIIVIVVGGIHVVSKLITGQDQSRPVVVGWVSSVVFYIVIFQIFG